MLYGLPGALEWQYLPHGSKSCSREVDGYTIVTGTRLVLQMSWLEFSTFSSKTCRLRLCRRLEWITWNMNAICNCSVGNFDYGQLGIPSDLPAFYSDHLHLHTENTEGGSETSSIGDRPRGGLRRTHTKERKTKVHVRSSQQTEMKLCLFFPSS